MAESWQLRRRIVEFTKVIQFIDDPSIGAGPWVSAAIPEKVYRRRGVIQGGRVGGGAQEFPRAFALVFMSRSKHFLVSQGSLVSAQLQSHHNDERRRYERTESLDDKASLRLHSR